MCVCFRCLCLFSVFVFVFGVCVCLPIRDCVYAIPCFKLFTQNKLYVINYDTLMNML